METKSGAYHVKQGSRHLHVVVEMIQSYNRKRKLHTKAKLKPYMQKIADYMSENNVELAAPLSMHLI